MARIRLTASILLLVVLSAALPAFAQDTLPLTHHYTSSDELIAFSYPADWAIDTVNDSSRALDVSVGTVESALNKDPINHANERFAPGEVRVNIVTVPKEVIAQVTQSAADASVADILKALITQVESTSIQFSVIQKTTVGDYPAARISFLTPQKAQGFLLLIDFGDLIGGVGVFTASGELERWEASALAIAASLTYAKVLVLTPEPTSTVATPESTPVATPESTPGAALDLTETFTSENGKVSLNYPSGWTIDALSESRTLLNASLANSETAAHKNLGTSDVFDSGDVRIQLQVLGEDEILQTPGVKPGSNPLEILDAVFQAAGTLSEDLSIGKASAASINDHLGAQVAVKGGAKGDGLIWLVRLDNGLNLVATVAAAQGELPKWEATMRAILESITIREAVTPESTEAP